MNHLEREFDRREFFRMAGRATVAVGGAALFGPSLAELALGRPGGAEAAGSPEVLPELTDYIPISFRMSNARNGIFLAQRKEPQTTFLSLVDFNTSKTLALTNIGLSPVDIDTNFPTTSQVARAKNNPDFLAVIGAVYVGPQRYQTVAWTTDRAKSWQQLQIKSIGGNLFNVFFNNENKVVVPRNNPSTSRMEFMIIDPTNGWVQILPIPDAPVNETILSATRIFDNNTQYFITSGLFGIHEVMYQTNSVSHRYINPDVVYALYGELEAVMIGGKQHVFAISPFTEGPEGRGTSTIYDFNIPDDIVTSILLREQYFPNTKNLLGIEAQVLASDSANNTLYVGAVRGGFDNIDSNNMRLALAGLQLDNIGNSASIREIGLNPIPRLGRWMNLDTQDGALFSGISTHEVNKSGVYTLMGQTVDWNKIIVRPAVVGPNPTPTLTPKPTVPERRRFIRGFVKPTPSPGLPPVHCMEVDHCPR